MSGRATIDYWCQTLAWILMAGCAGRQGTGLDGTAAAFVAADSVRTTAVAPGVMHTFAHVPAGPWAVHVVTIDTTRCSPVLASRKPGPSLGARSTTSRLGGAALVGINADFFMLPGGTPVGAQVMGGVPIIGPTDRVVFAATTDGWRIGVAEMRGRAVVRSDSAPVVQINRPAASFSAYRGTTDGLTLFTAWSGDTIARDTTATQVSLRLLSGNEATGRAVVVNAAHAANTTTSLGTNTVVIRGNGNARAWVSRRAPGDTVQWDVQVTVPPDGAKAKEVVGAFPELLRAGVPVLAGQTVRADFGAARHPRTAVGWRPDGTLLFVLVDGRQAPYSDGMTLDELTTLFQQLGASDAVNLDGGGSSALVVQGRVMNRPSDAAGERAVGNALVLERCR